MLAHLLEMCVPRLGGLSAQYPLFLKIHLSFGKFGVKGVWFYKNGAVGDKIKIKICYFIPIHNWSSNFRASSKIFLVLIHECPKSFFCGFRYCIEMFSPVTWGKCVMDTNHCPLKSCKHHLLQLGVRKRNVSILSWCFEIEGLTIVHKINQSLNLIW